MKTLSVVLSNLRSSGLPRMDLRFLFLVSVQAGQFADPPRAAPDARAPFLNNRAWTPDWPRPGLD
jgi:hypothetical protein